MNKTVQEVINYLISPGFISGAVSTLKLSILAQLLAILFAFFLAVGKRSRFKPIAWIINAYIWLFRGIPVMVQLIFAFNALPQLGLKLTGFWAAVLALTLNESAYMAEIIRSGLNSVSKGQQRAAHVLGMSKPQIMLHVTLPQALRVIIPPTGNQFIGMLKTSAIASTIGFGDLLRKALLASAQSFDYVSALIAASIYYLVFSAVFTFIFSLIEKKLDVTRRRKNVVKAVPEQ